MRKLIDWILCRPKSNPVQFETYKGANGQFYNRIKRSGEVIFDGGEGYHNRGDAERTVINTVRAIKQGNVELKSLLFVLVGCLLLNGCAFIPSNESKTANAKTAGNMEAEHQQSVRANFKEFASAATTNGGSIAITTTSRVRTADSEKWDYSFTRSLPFLITVGVGLLLLGAGGFVILWLHKALKKESAAYRTISSITDTGLAGIGSAISNFCATEKDDRVTTVLKTLDAEVQKVRGKVKAV